MKADRNTVENKNRYKACPYRIRTVKNKSR